MLTEYGECQLFRCRAGDAHVVLPLGLGRLVARIIFRDRLAGRALWAWICHRVLPATGTKGVFSDAHGRRIARKINNPGRGAVQLRNSKFSRTSCTSGEKPSQVRLEVGPELLPARSGAQVSQADLGRVVERLPRRRPQGAVLLDDLGFVEHGLHVEHRLLGVVEHRVEPAQHGRRGMMSRYLPGRYRSRRMSSAMPQMEFAMQFRSAWFMACHWPSPSAPVSAVPLAASLRPTASSAAVGRPPLPPAGPATS